MPAGPLSPAGSPCESPAAGLAQPGLHSHLLSFISPPTPTRSCVPRNSERHQRACGRSPRCFTLACGSPPGRPPSVSRGPYTPSRPSMVLPPTCCPSRVMAVAFLGLLSHRTDWGIHGHPLVWNRSLVEGSVPTPLGVLEAQGPFHLFFPASGT